MIRELAKHLGLDRVEAYVSQEVRRVQLQVLHEEKKVVESLLDRIERRIESLQGGKGGAKRVGRPRKGKKSVVRTRKPGERLRDFAVKAAARIGRSFTPAAIAAQVKALGYKTVADPQNLMTSLHKVLANRKVFAKVRRGIYALKDKVASSQAK